MDEQTAAVENQFLKSQIATLEQLLDVYETSVLEKTDELYAEIAQRKNIEETLRMTQFSVDIAVDAIFWLLQDASFFYVNDAACRLLGYSREELLKMSADDVNPAYDRTTWEPHWEEVKQRKSLTFEAAFRTKDGRMVLMAVSSNYVKFGNVAYICSFVRDITERKRAEEEIRHISAIQNLILENSTLGIALVRNRTFEWVNTRIGEMLMLPLDQIQGLPTRVIYPSDEVYEELGSKAYPILAGGERSDNVLQLQRNDGTLFWCRFIGKALNPAKPQDGSIWMFEDITERKQAEEELKFTNVLLSTTQETSIDGILVVDENARILSLNRRFVEMWGIPAKMVEEKVDEPVLQFTAAQLVDPRTSIKQIKYLYEHRQETSRDELPLLDGRVFDRYSAPMFGSDNQYYGRVWYFRDITERKNAEIRIQYLATHDSLTGLPNRLMFSQLLNHSIQSARHHKRQLAVFFIDLDHFKTINDTKGHDAGDQLLQEIALRYKQSLRAADVVSRLGGDEFIILIEEVNELSDIAIVANKIITSTFRPVVLLGDECRVTASIGISMYPKDGEDEQSLIKNADIAMYFAKEEGKNNYQFYSKDIQIQSTERLSLETNLRLALERKEFSLHYQAKVDFKTDIITGVEALLRWQNPILGSVTPTQFIPVAEETGLIISIGKWVLKTACAQNVAWQKQGLPAVCIAVNLSFRQLTDVNLIDDITAALNESGMAPNLLELEITESMVMRNPTHIIAVLAKIKSMGVRLAIDDFGTGYSSLAQIKHYPIDTLKVDRSFIRNIPKNAENKAITMAIIAMGKTLGLSIVAEGVETIEQMNFLKENSCDEMQGYYFSKPVVPQKFADLLRKHIPAPQNS